MVVFFVSCFRAIEIYVQKVEKEQNETQDADDDVETDRKMSKAGRRKGKARAQSVTTTATATATATASKIANAAIMYINCHSLPVISLSRSFFSENGSRRGGLV